MYLLLFFVLIGALFGLIQVGLLSIAFTKLGLSLEFGFLLLFFSLLGSLINIPLFQFKEQLQFPLAPVPKSSQRGFLFPLQPRRSLQTVIAINMGGGVIPVFFSFYLFTVYDLDLFLLVVAIITVSFVSYSVSRPIEGLGIGMPILYAPLTAAIIALVLDPNMSSVIAYISGTLGVLIGADLLRMRDIAKLGVPVAAIGGAGTYDGIFLTGIVAVLLT